jgi:hypothetical protein
MKNKILLAFFFIILLCQCGKPESRLHYCHRQVLINFNLFMSACEDMNDTAENKYKHLASKAMDSFRIEYLRIEDSIIRNKHLNHK